MINFCDKKGFTLIEILVALALGGLLVMAFSGAFSAGFRTEARMTDRMEARRVIDSVIEELRNQDFDEDLINEENSEDKSSEIKGVIEKLFPNDHELIIKEDEITKIQDNLYYFIIRYEDRGYHTEALIAIE